MSSVVFQPLLHDPLGWKASNSTYTDHFKWRRYRTTSKDKKISSYGQQYQRQQQQQQQQQQLHGAANREETIKRVSELKKDEDNRISSGSSRFAKPKTPLAIIDEPPVLIVEYKRRPVSTSNLDVSSGSRSSHRLATAVEEKRRPATSIDTQRHEKEDKRPIDPNNDNSRHWLTYPNPRTPQYLIDIKQRLGQLKVPSTLARPVSASCSSASNAVVQQQQEEQQLNLNERPSSASQHPQPSAERHFLSFAPTETPPELRAARYRIRKDRYNPSLDNYPPRPRTCPARSEDAKTSPTRQDYDDEQLPVPPPPKDEAWTVPDEESKTPEHESSSVLVQMVDVDGLPSEYVDALEIAAEAQEAYRRSTTSIGERRPDNPVYRLSATTPDINENSLVAFRNKQHSAQATATSMNNSPLRQVARSQNDFGLWVRNATERERASAMKILQDVLHQPMLGYDTPIKHQAIFKQPPAPPPVRASSATRKLGRTRTRHQFPCEICEKLLIKRHVWDLSRSDTMVCPHSAQGLKPPMTQIRT